MSYQQKGFKIEHKLSPILLCVSFISSSAFADTPSPYERSGHHPVKAPTLIMGKSAVKVGGYIKLDTMITSYNDGTINPPNPPSPGQDFLFPISIPVNAPPIFKSNPDFHMHAKQSRLWVKSETPIHNCTLNTTFEIDFINSTQGNELSTNGYSPRLRHAFGSLGEWLAGQTWSTFMDIPSYPELVDFGGPAGQIFVRQPQIRWTKMLHDKHVKFEAAIENPTVTFTPINSTVVDLTENKKYPDIVARFTYDNEIVHMGISGLARNLLLHLQNVSPLSPNKWTFAGNIFGKITPIQNSKDNLLFLANYGNALGRYVDYSFFPDAYITPTKSIFTPNIFAGYIGVQHFWCPTMRSSIVYGYSNVDIDKDDAINGFVSQGARSLHVNLMWNPYEPITVGIEYIWGERELVNDLEGNINRGQLGIQYNFG
ncbi:MAG: DcaP family trimeric outer membrane transporter [Candidatus Berkiellales bacterium]